MSAAPEIELQEESTTAKAPAPWVPDVRLLVDLPSRREIFLQNLRDLIRPPQLPALHLESAPAPFWHDVFVQSPLPWRRFFQSGGYHLLALALLIAGTRFLPERQNPAPQTFDRSQVIYYQPSEYLPPLDTRRARAAEPRKADPEFSRQPIISLPPEADNHAQTIVAPPELKLNHDVALPNIVAWSEKPKLPIAPTPLVPASNIERIAPQVDNAVVAPPPDAARISHRDAVTMQTSVVAPPPSVDSSSRALGRINPGTINIGPSAVIAPAPQLPVAAQRAFPTGATAGTAAQVVPPPPSVSGSPSVNGRRVIALNLHPAVGAPPDTPSGNRRGSFAATPSGHAGASGTPGSEAGGSTNGSGTNTAGSKSNGLPAGLYVGKAQPDAKTAAVGGNASASASPAAPAAAPNVPRSKAARPPQPSSAANLSEPERQVFGTRNLYSLTMSMPNLNSAGGTWIVRFAELKNDSAPGVLSAPEATRKVDPAYPMQLMRQNVSGTVILYAIIRADGSVGSVRVLRSVDDRLDRFAAQAVSQWRFDPATKAGVPVDVEATFHIPFRPALPSF